MSYDESHIEQEVRFQDGPSPEHCPGSIEGSLGVAYSRVQEARDRYNQAILGAFTVRVDCHGRTVDCRDADPDAVTAARRQVDQADSDCRALQAVLLFPPDSSV